MRTHISLVLWAHFSRWCDGLLWRRPSALRWCGRPKCV
jgi:hypothetical protein